MDSNLKKGVVMALGIHSQNEMVEIAKEFNNPIEVLSLKGKRLKYV